MPLFELAERGISVADALKRGASQNQTTSLRTVFVVPDISRAKLRFGPKVLTTNPPGAGVCFLAEREGFEPSIQLPV